MCTITVSITAGIPQLDLSSREDHAKVEINPFTLAAKNKRSRVKQAFVNNNIAARPQYADGEDWPRITVSASDRGKNGSLTITRRGLTGLSISQNDDRI